MNSIIFIGIAFLHHTYGFHDSIVDSALLQQPVTSKNDCNDIPVVFIDRFSENDDSWGDASYFIYSYEEDERTTLLATSRKSNSGTDKEMWCFKPGHYIAYLSESSFTDLNSYSVKVCGTTMVNAGGFVVLSISGEGTCDVVLDNRFLTPSANIVSSKADKFETALYSSNEYSMDYSDIDFSEMLSMDFSELFSMELSDGSSMEFSDGSSMEFSDDSSMDFTMDFSMDFSAGVLTFSPTNTPTISPTVVPTSSPTVVPTSSPTVVPTSSPTVVPTSSPTASPTSCPTLSPTGTPTVSPTPVPTFSPTITPTMPGETNAPTLHPTVSPTLNPTSNPTSVPTSSAPTYIPTSNPTNIYDTLEASNRTTTCYSDCSYPGMTVDPADWGDEEYCQFYASTTCSEEAVAAYSCVPDCLLDCSDVFCDSMSTLVYACDPDSSATFANKTVLETECLDSYAADAETETLLEFDTVNTFDDVSADEMRNDTASQQAAISAMSLSMSGVPASQISIKSIEDASTRRMFRRSLQSSGAEVTFNVLAKLEQLGYKSTEGDAAYSSLTNQISQSVSSGEFQQNLKAAGQTVGVTTFDNAKVQKTPTYSEPVVIAVVTVQPTSFPTSAPTLTPKKSDDDVALSDGEIAGIVIGSVVGFCLLVFGAYICWDKKRLGDMEEQFKQHNFLTRMRSRSSAGSQPQRSEGPQVKSFDSIDMAYKSKDEYQGMDIEMEAKRQSDLEERRISEMGDDADARAARKARRSDV